MSSALHRFPGGVHLPDHKSLSNTLPIAPGPVPEYVILPLHQHIGESAEALVKAGDYVLKGQMIGRAKGYVSAPVHASISGIVRAVEARPVPHPSGLNALCVVIDNDGRDTWVERHPRASFDSIDPSHLRNLIRDAGIVGLGGAGFPSFIKLNPGPGKKVETLILNGVECEPYITCDDRLMRERSLDILMGIHIIRFALQAKRVLIAIEDNKPEALAAMRQVAAGTGFEVVAVPTHYPAGGEKQLIYTLTGKEVPKNNLPIHLGIVCQNVATAVAVYRAILLGEPLVSRVVTVTGPAVQQPRNLDITLGTPVRQLLDCCGYEEKNMHRLLMGGPMMGFQLPTDTVPAIKTTNCILAQTAALSARGPEMPCIRCGACAEVCPARLLPQQLYWHAHAQDLEKVQHYDLFDCIECGCCAYVCPSNIPLVHYYRYAKTEIWSAEREKKKAEAAKNRYEFRLQRIDREKSERAQRHEKKKEELTTTTPDASDPKKAAILAALERAQAKKAAAGVAPKNVDNLSTHQQQQIAEAEARRAQHSNNPRDGAPS